jgi:hypothetical protein
MRAFTNFLRNKQVDQPMMRARKPLINYPH